jgi:hypothetical protein
VFIATPPAQVGKEHQTDDTTKICSCARAYLQSTQYDPTPRLGQEDIYNRMRANAHVSLVSPSLLLSFSPFLKSSLRKVTTGGAIPLEHLAGSPRRDVRAACACFPASDLIASPGPSRTAALAAENVYIGR